MTEVGVQNDKKEDAQNDGVEEILRYAQNNNKGAQNNNGRRVKGGGYGADVTRCRIQS